MKSPSELRARGFFLLFTRTGATIIVAMAIQELLGVGWVVRNVVFGSKRGHALLTYYFPSLVFWVLTVIATETFLYARRVRVGQVRPLQLRASRWRRIAWRIVFGAGLGLAAGAVGAALGRTGELGGVFSAMKLLPYRLWREVGNIGFASIIMLVWLLGVIREVVDLCISTCCKRN